MNSRLVLELFVQALAFTAVTARNLTASFELLAYSDVYEMLQDSVNGLKIGGPSRVVPLVRQMREANPNSLVLFAGDTMSPSLWSSQFHGMQMVDAHNALDVDFASLGNHEFDFGIEGFLNVSAASTFPWLNANCYEISTGQLLRGTQPNAVKTLTNPQFGNITVGLFGVMYDLKDSSKGLKWTDPLAAAKTQVAELQKKKVDFIIALTHQVYSDDDILSQEVSGIDLIIGGHDHKAVLQANFGTPYLKSDLDFRTVWRSRIEYFASDANNTRTARMAHNLVPVTEEMESDCMLDAIIAGYDSKMSVIKQQVLGSMCEPLDLRTSVVRAQDCAVGNFFADACLKFYGEGSADVAVMNGGGIRTDRIVPAGDLTYGELMSWSPFGNTLMTVSTNGKSLKLYIEHEMLGSCGDGLQKLNGFYVHTAGVKYTFTCTGSKVGSVANLEWYEHPTRTGPVADDEEFVLAISNYLYTIEFLATKDVTSEVIVSEAEAERVDLALQEYVLAQPEKDLCIKTTGRTEVVFA